MDDKMYDIAIVGGGPAGATLARLTGNQYRVLLLEKRTFQEPLYGGLQKCCGGLIAPDAQKMLASVVPPVAKTRNRKNKLSSFPCLI